MGFVSSISTEIASFCPHFSRKYSIIINCIPKHIPRVGMFFSRTSVKQRIIAFRPVAPNPPGTTTASISAKNTVVSSGGHRASYHLMRKSIKTRACSCICQDAWCSASNNEQYASGCCTYFPMTTYYFEGLYDKSEHFFLCGFGLNFPCGVVYSSLSRRRAPRKSFFCSDSVSQLT